jgi:hypothetical protein
MKKVIAGIKFEDWVMATTYGRHPWTNDEVIQLLDHIRELYELIDDKDNLILEMGDMRE